MNKKLGVALLLTCNFAALPAWADHDADDRHLNNYELTFASSNSRRIDAMSSQSFETGGTPAEIIGRAQSCVAKYVSNQPATSDGVLGIGAQGQHSSSTEAEQPVLDSANPDDGTLAANNRAKYRHLLLSYEAKSKLSIEAKDGHFRILQTELGYRQLDTGNGSAQDFSPIQRLAVTGWDSALEALQEVSDNVADCIKSK